MRNQSNGVFLNAGPTGEMDTNIFVSLGPDGTQMFRLPFSIPPKLDDTTRTDCNLVFRIGTNFSLDLNIYFVEAELEPRLTISTNFFGRNESNNDAYRRIVIFDGRISDIIPPANYRKFNQMQPSKPVAMLFRRIISEPDVAATNALINSLPVIPGLERFTSREEFINYFLPDTSEVEDEDTSDQYGNGEEEEE